MLKSLSKLSLIVFIFAIPLNHIHAQSNEHDMNLITSASYDSRHIHSEHHHNIVFLLSDHPSAFVRLNPVTLVFGSLMWTYQKVISPQFSSTCLYSPSCSTFSINLISDYGIVPGLFLTADRLMRCNRLALMDYKSWELDTSIGKIREGTSYYKINE